jgi:hypothetical protein
MSVEAAAPDRLPWLSDEPAARPPRGRSGALAAACAAILVVGAGAFWMGARSVDEGPVPARPQASATIRLPAAQPAQPRPVQQVEPIVGSPIPIVAEESHVQHAPVRAAKVHKPHKKAEPAAKPIVIAKAEPPAPPEPWPVRAVDGASGRMVRIGAFVSPHQAKRGWWAITRVNPAIAHLPALVVPVQSLRNGRVYYRLQMGTTSQAHSAVLCQRMRMIAQSCVVIGSGAGTA